MARSDLKTCRVCGTMEKDPTLPHTVLCDGVPEMPQCVRELLENGLDDYWVTTPEGIAALKAVKEYYGEGSDE